MRTQINFEDLRSRLKVHSQAAQLALRQHHPDAFKLLSSGILAGTLLLSSGPTIAQVNQQQNISADMPVMLQLDTSQKLKSILPPVGDWNLSTNQENEISNLMAEDFGIKAVAQLGGNRLPNSFGRMGAEQHLARFPGDQVENMAPGLGGWGYVPEEEEKWYVAVPIIYLPDWHDHVQYYVDWYKFRKMAVVNPANGKTVITAVADAGPANWTGKHFGGSPEVMNYLGIDYGMQNHPVVMFFLDDPNHEVPLGPLEYNIQKNKEELRNKS